jgi:hypothetical protein
MGLEGNNAQKCTELGRGCRNVRLEFGKAGTDEVSNVRLGDG